MDIEEKLYRIYEDTKEWVKFAEAKNAALLTFNGAIFFWLLKNFTGNTQNLPQFASKLGIVLLGINIIFLLISFLPLFNTDSKPGTKLPNANTNLLFYRSIYNIIPRSYLKAISKSYFDDNNDVFTKKERDLINQILSLAKIATRKYKIFTFCTTITIIALTIIFLFFVI